MTNPDSFFDDSVRSGAPSVRLSDINDGVVGEIVDQFMTEKKKFGSDEVEKDSKTGEPIQQLVVILQTELRNWQRVSKVPLIDPKDKSKGEKPASEDDGKRAVYIPPYTNIHSAVGRATAVHNNGRPTGLRNGARFGLKVVDLEDVGKGNRKKVFQALYEPPTATDGFFGNDKAAGGPNDASRPAPESKPEPQDPWATSGSTSSEREEEPPF